MATEIRLSRESKEAEKTPQEKAIELLYKEYESRLSEDSFVEVVTFFESESKARIFIALKEGNIRDSWLEKNTSIRLI
jgi:hypothetical protein